MKRNRLSLVFLAAALAGLSNSPAARADAGNKPAAAEKLSEVNFPISCGAAAQKKFNQAGWILRRGGQGLYCRYRDRARLRDGLLGCGDEPLVPALVPAHAAALKAGSEAVEKAMAAKQKTDRESD